MLSKFPKWLLTCAIFHDRGKKQKWVNWQVELIKPSRNTINVFAAKACWGRSVHVFKMEWQESYIRTSITKILWVLLYSLYEVRKNKRDEEKAKNKKSMQCFHIYFLNNLLKRQKPLSNDKGRKIFEESFVFWLSAALQKTLPYESLLLLNNLI